MKGIFLIRIDSIDERQNEVTAVITIAKEVENFG
jgi:hypothetical protein